MNRIGTNGTNALEVAFKNETLSGITKRKGITMKKVIAILAIVFTMTMAVACNPSNSSNSSPNNGGSETVIPEESGNNSENGGNEENKSEVVSPITGGGSFNVGDNYNK